MKEKVFLIFYIILLFLIIAGLINWKQQLDELGRSKWYLRYASFQYEMGNQNIMNILFEGTNFKRVEPLIYIQIGILYYINGNYESALKYIEKGRVEYPNEPEIEKYLAATYLKLGMKEKGLKLINKYKKR